MDESQRNQYEWANSLGQEWLWGTDDVIVSQLQRLILAGLSESDAKEIIASLVKSVRNELYVQFSSCP